MTHTTVKHALDVAADPLQTYLISMIAGAIGFIHSVDPLVLLTGILVCIRIIVESCKAIDYFRKRSRKRRRKGKRNVKR